MLYLVALALLIVAAFKYSSKTEFYLGFVAAAGLVALAAEYLNRHQSRLRLRLLLTLGGFAGIACSIVALNDTEPGFLLLLGGILLGGTFLARVLMEKSMEKRA